jgi:hypothetical protein
VQLCKLQQFAQVEGFFTLAFPLLIGKLQLQLPATAAGSTRHGGSLIC